MTPDEQAQELMDKYKTTVRHKLRDFDHVREFYVKGKGFIVVDATNNKSLVTMDIYYPE